MRKNKLERECRYSKLMRFSRYVNEGQMYVRLNGDQLEEVNCFRHLGSQVAADRGCERDMVHRMNEECKQWGALKSVLSKAD